LAIKGAFGHLIEVGDGIFLSVLGIEVEETQIQIRLFIREKCIFGVGILQCRHGGMDGKGELFGNEEINNILPERMAGLGECGDTTDIKSPGLCPINSRHGLFVIAFAPLGITQQPEVTLNVKLNFHVGICRYELIQEGFKKAMPRGKWFATMKGDPDFFKTSLTGDFLDKACSLLRTQPSHLRAMVRTKAIVTCGRTVQRWDDHELQLTEHDSI
jgi:hypothetical protein